MKYFLYILMVISIVACNRVDRPQKPKNLISKEKMSDIMYDLYVLNAAKGVNRKLLEQKGIMPLEYVYKKYKIDSLQFAQSNAYYSYDTDVYTGIVEQVKAQLQKDKELYEDLTEKDQQKKDSLKDVRKRLKDTLILE